MGNSHEFHNMSLFLWQWGVNCAVLPKTITEISEKYNGMHDFRFVGNEFIADIWLKKK